VLLEVVHNLFSFPSHFIPALYCPLRIELLCKDVGQAAKEMYWWTESAVLREQGKRSRNSKGNPETTVQEH